MTALVCDWVRNWAAHRGNHVAVHFEGADISYAQLADLIDAHAAALHGLSVGVGDRVALLGYNTPEYIATIFACARIGAIAVPLNWRLAPPEHSFILADSGATVLLADAELVAATATIDAPLIAHRRLLSGCQAHWPRLLDATPTAEAPRYGSADAPLLLVYTSGTTGRPKGAVLTQHAVWVNAINGQHAHDLTAADHVLTNLPMFHVGGLNIQTLPALHAGAQITLHRQFDPGVTLIDIAQRRPTLALLVPATMSAMVNHPAWRETDLSSLRMLMTGSSTVPDALIRAFHNRGIPVGQIYGATETCPIAAFLRAEHAFDHMGSTGKAPIHGELTIATAGGAVPLPGQKGEILVRGGNIMREYWNNPDATQTALRDGWFHTGDIGHLDEQGFLYVDDRLQDVIISGGENIYPAELENVLADCELLAEFAVIGRADLRWGEVPVVIAVPHSPESFDPQEVLTLFSGRLARFKHPARVEVRASLPRNAMGKVLKYELRAAQAC